MGRYFTTMFERTISNFQVLSCASQNQASVTVVKQSCYIPVLTAREMLQGLLHSFRMFERGKQLDYSKSELARSFEKNTITMMPRVLVVDDEPDVCFIISNILKSNGFEAQESHSVAECFRVLESYRPDFIILDIDLPDGSGLEALPKINALYPNIKVVMNSALDTAENREKAQENGAYAFLGKPLNKKKLLDALIIT